MKNAYRFLSMLALFGALSCAAFARNIFGYIGFGPNWIQPIVGCTVELYKENGQYVTKTRAYWHPFGINKMRYHFSGNIDYAKYYVVVKPVQAYGQATSTKFKTEWAIWSDTQAPNVWVR